MRRSFSCVVELSFCDVASLYQHKLSRTPFVEDGDLLGSGAIRLGFLDGAGSDAGGRIGSAVVHNHRGDIPRLVSQSLAGVLFGATRPPTS